MRLAHHRLMHAIITRRAEGLGDAAVSIGTVASLCRWLHLDLIILDHQLEALIATRRGAEILDRFPRARRRELAARVALTPPGRDLALLRLDEEQVSGVELGAFPLADGLAIVIAGPGSQRSPAVDGLRQLYGLTPAESKVARSLATGRSPKQIATDLEVELSTVRTHLRSVHVKLGAASQGDLIRRLLTSIATFVGDTAADGEQKPEPLDTCDDAPSAAPE